MHLGARTLVPINDDMLDTLEKRLGRLHARQRLGIEKDHEAQVFGQGLNFFHIENLTLSHSLIRAVLMAHRPLLAGHEQRSQGRSCGTTASPRRSCRRRSTASPSFSSATCMWR